ncbi:MAG: hypothetical protein ABIT58_08090 [Ferruginibacter sp.]
MKKTIRTSVLCLICCLTTGIFVEAKAQQGFDKASFYKVMENGKIDAVEAQLKITVAATGINNDAYTGALLMKKAGLVKGPANKLGVFKNGRNKLEGAITADAGNIEWHFLRLIIQEHAPKILGYRDDIKKDAELVHINFKKLPPELQAAVLDYRKQSDTLQPLNF